MYTCISVYIVSIQPVNKAVEHLINSTPVLEREKRERKKAINAYLKNKKNSKGGGGHHHKESEGLGGVLWVYKIGLK